MDLFCLAIILLRLSLVTSVNFTQVFEWPDGLDYEWPSEAKRTRALKYGTSDPEKIVPLFMAVFGTRIFLSLEKYNVGIPVTLVSLPTSSKKSSAPPKLTPFPSWDIHKKYGDCNNIDRATGLEVDSVGRLWVLDDGGFRCNSKQWIFDLSNNDHTILIHHFHFCYDMHNLVLDETPNGYFAYIARWGEPHIVVFSLEREDSSILYTPGMNVFSIALSPKEEARQLYLSRYNSTELYSIPIPENPHETQTVNPKLTRNWKARPYRILMDNHGTMYAAFLWENHIISWNTDQPYQEQHFHEAGKLDMSWPFAFALDSLGTFWVTVFNNTGNKPSFRLLKAAVGAKPYTSDSPTTQVGRFTGKGQTDKSTNSALIGSLAFLLVLSCFIVIWLSLRMKKSIIYKEQCNGVAMEMAAIRNSVSLYEEVDEGIENALYRLFTAPPP